MWSFTDIDECDSEPCANGGTCYDFENRYQCQCVEGYDGDQCEIGKICQGPHSFQLCEMYNLIS